VYAIVDIETTGGHASANGITEISIRIFDGEKLIENFETLVNPGQPIPRYIQAFTGINDAMVADAPSFDEVAPRVHSLLADRIFVAHNVNFDYSFVKSQLNHCGFELSGKKLCTVRLSRKIFPGLQSYSLGKLCHSLGIEIRRHHRAGSDTEATLKLFELLLQNDREQHIHKSLLRNSKEQVLPPNVPKEHFEQLPYTPGVYYFHNEKGKVIYVGKATNIRYRVNSHFSNNSVSRQKQNFLRHTHAISYTSCATELMASILESTEIKKLWPEFNYSQKRPELVYGIYDFEDQKGYIRLAIEKNRKQLLPLYSFHYLVDGHTILRKLMRDFQLCPRLCFMQTDEGSCEGIKEATCLGACEGRETTSSYNLRVQQAIDSLQKQPSFAIIEKGLKTDERSCVLVWNGRFYGMGYLPTEVQVTEAGQLKDHLTPYPENSFIRNLINGYAARYPASLLSFSKD